MNRIGLRMLASFALVLFAARCGGDDICLNCEAVPTPTPGPRDTITVVGDIAAWSTFDPVEAIVVLVCVDLDPAIVAPEGWNGCDKKTGTPDADGNFTVSKIAPMAGSDTANLRVAFWIPRSDPPTGQIEPTDSFAELTQPADQIGELDDVRVNRTVSISGVDVNFGTMVATAGRIQVMITPTPTPGAIPTPTP